MRATEAAKEAMKLYYQANKGRLDNNRKDLYYSNHKHELAVRRKYFRTHKIRRYFPVHTWNKKRLLEVYSLLGNKCYRCGYENMIALEIHHKDGSSRKTRRVRDYLKLGYNLLKVELVCANCHKIEHYSGTKEVLL
jgi:hypothetical protein